MDEQGMQFNEADRQAMLKLKGVGATVISRIEQLGFYSLAQLQNQEAETITKQISQMMGSTCWHNSPQALAAIQAVIDLAQRSA
jgi:hypothetical protein